MNDEKEIERLKKVVGTLICWIAQSSVSPISVDEAGKLLLMLEKPKKPK